MIDIQPTHFEMVTSILAEYVGEYEVRAFGSRVKQTATTFSDLDLVIMTDEPLSLRLLTQLDNAFSDSDLPWKVDIVDWATTSEEFRAIILQQYEVVQGK